MTDRLLAGRYRLGERLGGGGSATVVAARDEALDRAVAVKLLASGSDVARERFAREARAAASLSHPNVVVVYDVGHEDGQLYLVMELVPGGDLATLLAGRGALPEADAVRIADGVLAALEVLHRAGIVHRDVKPANVLLAPDGTVKLTDFGIARPDDSPTLTTTGSVLGTPAYLPPEQALGEQPSTSGDLYSLGAVCFEMLAGAPPFGRGTSAGVALAHIREPVPRVRDARPDVAAPLAAVVERALAKDPADRWPDAAAMRAALAAAATVDRAPEDSPGRAADDGDELATRQVRGLVPVPLSDATEAGSRAALATPTVVDVLAGPSPTGGLAGADRRATGLVVGTVAAVLVAVVASLFLGQGEGGGGDGTVGAGVGAAAPSEVADGEATTSAPSTAAPPAAAPSPTTASATTPSTTAAPITGAPILVPVLQIPADPTVESLRAALEADPGLAGERGADLLERLREVADAKGKRRRDRAREALADVDAWAGAGQLEPAVAAAARQVLVPLAGLDGDDDD
jgi:serine/threonine-protein kinase